VQESSRLHECREIGIRWFLWPGQTSMSFLPGTRLSWRTVHRIARVIVYRGCLFRARFLEFSQQQRAQRVPRSKLRRSLSAYEVELFLRCGEEHCAGLALRGRLPRRWLCRGPVPRGAARL